MHTPLRHETLRLLVGFIRSCKTICRELKSFIEVLVLLAVGVWGFLHVVQILFGKAR
jgi:hypothetical protein